MGEMQTALWAARRDHPHPSYPSAENPRIWDSKDPGLRRNGSSTGSESPLGGVGSDGGSGGGDWPLSRARATPPPPARGQEVYHHRESGASSDLPGHFRRESAASRPPPLNKGSANEGYSAPSIEPVRFREKREPHKRIYGLLPERQDQNLALAGSERRGNNIKRVIDFYLKAKAKIWPWLGYMCHVRSETDAPESSTQTANLKPCT